MAKSETIAALDIGTSKVACAFAEFYREGDVRIEVKAHSEIDCREINGAGINFLALGDVVEELFDRMEKISKWKMLLSVFPVSMLDVLCIVNIR